MAIKINIRKLWTLSLVLYIICSTAFSYGSIKILNSLTLYFFLGVSALNIVFKGKAKVNFAAGVLIAYAVFSLVGMLYTPTSFSRVLQVMYDYITMTILAFCIVQYIESMEDVKLIIQAYMIAGMALAVYVYSLYGGSFWTIMREAGQASEHSVTRLGKELTNVNTISLCTAVSAIIAAFHLMYDRKSKVRTFLCASIAVFCFLVSMAAASKKAIVLIIVCFCCIWFYNAIGTRNILRQIRSLFLFAGMIVLLLYMIYNVPLFSGIAMRLDSLFSFLSGGSGTSSEIGRSTLIKDGLAVWWDHLLFGAGTASSTYYLGVYAHNNYVELLMNSGLVGFLVFYSVYVYGAVKYLRNAILYKTSDRITILLFALFCGITICGMALVYYYDRYYMYLLTTIFSAINILDAQKQSVSVKEGRKYGKQEKPGSTGTSAL